MIAKRTRTALAVARKRLAQAPPVACVRPPAGGAEPSSAWHHGTQFGIDALSCNLRTRRTPVGVRQTIRATHCKQVIAQIHERDGAVAQRLN